MAPEGGVAQAVSIVISLPHNSRWTPAAVRHASSIPPSTPLPERSRQTLRYGRTTASGEVYDMHALTAAHPSLPLGTLVEVRNLENDRRVQVRINDRGPHVKRRVIDLSYAAAQHLDMIGPGTARVEIVVVGPGEEALAAGYTVQVGAFRDPERARLVCEDLRRTFPEATVNGDGTWHRVQIGDFPRRRQAEDLRRELRRLGMAALVVTLR